MHQIRAVSRNVHRLNRWQAGNCVERFHSHLRSYIVRSILQPSQSGRQELPEHWNFTQQRDFLLDVYQNPLPVTCDQGSFPTTT